jgi:CheY-like chemotaxis protein
MPILYRGFENPASGLQFVLGAAEEGQFMQRYLDFPVPNTFGNGSVGIRYQDLYQHLYNPQRFELVTTVVVDYDMPGMNGLEVCEKLAHTHVQRLMITGAADEDLAVKAFNERKIHAFIRKESPSFLDNLVHHIIRAQRSYFRELLGVITQTLQVSGLSPALSDPAFQAFFHQLIQKHHIAEYYQLDVHGSFLLVDAQGGTRCLFVASEDKVRADQLEVQSAFEEELPASLRADLLSGKKILCTYDPDGAAPIPPISQWPALAHPATLVEGAQNYYCAVIPSPVPLQAFTPFNDVFLGSA